MTVQTIVLATAIVTLATASIGAFVAVWSAIKGIEREVHKVHLVVNSRLDELLELTRKSARAEGLKEGMDRPSSRE